MNLAVAGITLIVGIIIGIASFIMIADLEETVNMEKIAKSKEDAPVSAIIATVKNIECKEKIQIGVIAVLIAICAYQLCGRNYYIFTLGRYFVVLFVLASVTIIDGYTHKIPNKLVLLLLTMGIVFLLGDFLFFKEEVLFTFIQSTAGLLSCLVLFYVLARLTKEGIGMGDVKLIASMGWMLGLSTTLIIVIVALCICMITALFLLFGKKKNKNDFIPFGPFLFFGYIITILVFHV